MDLGMTLLRKWSGDALNKDCLLFFDNFYMSVKLIKDLFALLTPSCGTVKENRKNFRASMKGVKKWVKNVDRGDMQWNRDGWCLAQQWKDNKVVIILTSINTANDHAMAKRNVKVNGRWQKIEVKQPKAIVTYNKYMNGIDRSGQLLAKKNTLKKCLRWWKVLF